MTFERETLAEDAVKLGFSHAGLAKIETLKPMDEVRDMCAVDKCHAYNKTWTCPPRLRHHCPVYGKNETV